MDVSKKKKTLCNKLNAKSEENVKEIENERHMGASKSKCTVLTCCC